MVYTLKETNESRNEYKRVERRSMAQQSDVSRIGGFFNGGVVFLTGATGFLGKLILEKLLRTTDVRKIFVLVRVKKGKPQSERYREIFESPVFDSIKDSNEERLKASVELVAGDCALPDLGISPETWKQLEDEVQVVIHCAATIRFDQILRTAFNINIRATRDLLSHARNMRNLKSVVYVSTAYSNCTRSEIDELIYEPPIDYKQLGNLLETFSEDEFVNKLTPTILGEWPNTYVFTKCVCEHMVQELFSDLPIAVFRPSMVTSTYMEPLEGYVDNFYGPIGVSLGVAMGLLRVLHCDQENRADMVPADFCVNALLATAWNTGNENVKEGTIAVYNYASAEHSLNWRIYMTGLYKMSRKYASEKQIWRVTFFMVKNRWQYKLYEIFLHTIPAHVFDSVCKLMGKEARMVDGYKRIDKFTTAINYFTLRQWTFHWGNTKKLWLKLTAEDQKMYEFRVSSLNWDFYFDRLTFGGIRYLLKENVDNLQKNKFRYRMLVAAHWTLVGFLLLMAYFILGYCFRLFF